MAWEQTAQVWESNSALEPTLKAELSQLAKDKTKMEEAFTTPMSFGTAGMRGLLGPGINRMNIYTVRQATEGLARLMDTLDDATKQRGVAISFDSRYHSREFAHEAARVLGKHEIPSFVFDDMRPTPELSFAVRQLHTYAGIMITASHNPKQYNGFKIYGEAGGQMPPVESDKITQYVREASDLFAIEVANEADLRASGLMQLIGEDIDEPYLAQVMTVSVDKDLIQSVGANMSMIYTPLHGTGKVIGERALRKAGFQNFEMVVKQAIADPEFPTTPFPNPEFTQVFDMAIEMGSKSGADLLVATDPDADRLGAAVRQPDGTYQLMTGNQIASVLLNYLLMAKQNTGTLPANGEVVKSIVSTELATRIAEKFGVKMTSVLTGFKYIAAEIAQDEVDHEHEFLFGFEESYGYLVKPFVRDKDAIQSTILLAEVAAYYKQQGQTLYDGIQSLYQEYGYFAERTISETFEGVNGADQMANLMTEFRDNPHAEIAGTAVEALEDFDTSIVKNRDGSTGNLTLPRANVLKYWLEDGTWIAIRPSGTEPKLKFYVGTEADTEAAAEAQLEKYDHEIHMMMKPL